MQKHPETNARDLFRVGNRWFNPAHVAAVEVIPAPAGTPDQPGAKLHLATGGTLSVWEFHGDDAEAVLKELGFDKDAREKEAKAKAKAVHDAEQAAAKAEADAAKKAAQEEKAAHKK